jgi:hypothetical protein
MPWAGTAAYRDGRQSRREGRGGSCGHCESQASESQPRIGGLHAVPSRDHHCRSAACHPAAGSRAFLLRARTAVGGFPVDVRPRGRNGRQICHLPRLPCDCVGTDGPIRNTRSRRELCKLPHAEAEDRRCGACGDDGPLHSKPPAARRSAGGEAGGARIAGDCVSRRSGSLLSGQTRVDGEGGFALPGAGADPRVEQSEERIAPARGSN